MGGRSSWDTPYVYLYVKEMVIFTVNNTATWNICNSAGRKEIKWLKIFIVIYKRHFNLYFEKDGKQKNFSLFTCNTKFRHASLYLQSCNRWRKKTWFLINILLLFITENATYVCTYRYVETLVSLVSDSKILIEKKKPLELLLCLCNILGLHPSRKNLFNR